MKILIFGGIGEAHLLANKCIEWSRTNSDVQVLYSLAGRARVTSMNCEVLVGGFGGIEGISNYLTRNGISLVVDATHPYAATISRNIAIACEQASVSLLRYSRKPWLPTPVDQWRHTSSNSELLMAIANYKRPFFTIGRSVLDLLDQKSQDQFWLVRYFSINNQKQQSNSSEGFADNSKPVKSTNSRCRIDTGHSDCTLINDVGPFEYEQERCLMERYNIDVLVSKNSGGSAVAAKIRAAADLAIPVVMLQRPKIETISQQYSNMEDLFARIVEVVDHQYSVCNY